MSGKDKISFLLWRIRKYGILKVANELLFRVYYDFFLRNGDESLRKSFFPKDFFNPEIMAKDVPVYEVDSINSPKGKELLKQLEPDLILMESREMIARDVLGMSRVGFVGCHPGIIPEYKGVYASFWALCRNEPDKVGYSVYLADSGVDTGGIIIQRHIQPKFDIKHFKVESEKLIMDGAKDMISVIDMAEKGKLKTHKRDSAPNGLFSHIGLSDYIKAISSKSKQ